MRLYCFTPSLRSLCLSLMFFYSSSRCTSMDNTLRRHSLEPTFKEFGPALAEDFSKIVDFMSVDSDRVLFRRFSKVNLYNLLFLQHRLGLISHEIELFTSQNDVDKLQKLLPSLNAALESYSG